MTYVRTFAVRRWTLSTAALLMAGMACSLLQRTGGAEPTAEGAVGSLEDVSSAVVQIEAQGSFADPQEGWLVNAAGRGSGFIIDPTGITVTNNHVVTGAALLKVWVGGESTPRNARILGVSECSDLAVIDIEGEGYPYLQWYEGEIKVGMDVYAAGFPLGEPEFTLTRGVISKESASGESNWASLGSVLGHDATINPGNSGGPLVDAEGRVVGINYRSRPAVNQYFAIPSGTAIGTIERLRLSEDVDSIGVNGVAVQSEDGSTIGIWVSSVESGSPADEAGLQPGDILSAMEGLTLAMDGTMSDYCDILRTHNAGDTLSIEVLRFSTGEFLTGQLNGRPLEVTFSFENQIGDEVEQTSGGAAETYTDYVRVTDDYGAIQLEIPAAWSDVDGSAWTDENGGVVGSAISASPNQEALFSGYSTPGVFFGASDDLARLGGYVQLLDLFREGYLEDCELEGRFDYDDSVHQGKYDLYKNCGGPDQAWLLVLSAVPKDASQALLILVQVQILTEADVDALDRILTSFEVVGSLP